jgi:hypothetical protein
MSIITAKAKLCAYHKGINGIRGIALLMLNLGTTWRAVLRYPMNREQMGPQAGYEPTCDESISSLCRE